MPLPTLVSRNGELIQPSEACVSVFNPALYGSYGVYESLQIVDSQPFALSAHLERLTRSAALIDLPLPAEISTLQRWIADVLRANDATNCVLRLFVLGPENGGQVTAYIWPQPVPTYPTAFYTEGATAITFEGQRYLPAAKTLNTLVSFLAQRRARSAGVHEALLYDCGQFTEGSNSNLFAVQNGVLRTAPAEQVLSGVARDTVLHLARQNGLEVLETSLPVTDLDIWSECFITSTSRHVMPITAIDGRPVDDGRVGPYTRRMMALFEEHFRAATGT